MFEIHTNCSFDRFGDDMCALVLSFLPFADKKRFECVSKQWQRSVYQRQYELTIDEPFFKKLTKSDPLGKEFLNLKAFKVFAKKLESIDRLVVKYNTFWSRFSEMTKMIEIVVKCCDYVKRIECDFVHITDDKANKFFEKFGPKLSKIRFYIQDNIAFGKSFCINSLKFCTNLCELNVMYLSFLFYGNNNCLANNLRKITFCFFNWDTNAIEKFTDGNHHTLQCLEAYLPQHIQPLPLSIFMEQLTRLSQLKSLKLVFLDFYSYSIVSDLEEIAVKCHGLESLQLRFFSETISQNIEIFNAIKRFQRLRRLDLSLYTGYPSEAHTSLASNSLSECRQLTHLTLKANQYVINDQFFVDIHIHLPKLQSLDVWNADINGLAFEYLAKLKDIRLIYLSSFKPKQIMETRVYELILYCKNIRVIELENFETIDIEDVEYYLQSNDNSIAEQL